MIGRLVHRLRREANVTATVVVPKWEEAVWWASLEALAVKRWDVPGVPDPLASWVGPEVEPRRNRGWRLSVFLVRKASGVGEGGSW